jgi:hypothetical protein
MGWFTRRKQAYVMDDAEVAREMCKLADGFIVAAAADDWHFGWDGNEVSRLDAYCDLFISDKAPPEIQHSVIMTMGAYLGELMVRCGGGHWTYDPKERAAVIEMPNGLRAYPHNKVAKRIEYGAEQSLAPYYHYGLTRELLPGSELTEW